MVFLAVLAGGAHVGNLEPVIDHQAGVADPVVDAVDIDVFESDVLVPELTDLGEDKFGALAGDVDVEHRSFPNC